MSIKFCVHVHICLIFIFIIVVYIYLFICTHTYKTQELRLFFISLFFFFSKELKTTQRPTIMLTLSLKFVKLINIMRRHMRFLNIMNCCFVFVHVEERDIPSCFQATCTNSLNSAAGSVIDSDARVLQYCTCNDPHYSQIPYLQIHLLLAVMSTPK